MAYENKTGLPSTTTVLSCFVNTDFFTDEDRERGNTVHSAMKSYLLGLWAPPVKEEWQGYVDSGRRWADNNIDKIALVEKRLCDRVYGYTGQLDTVSSLKNKTGNGVIDWKTAFAESVTWKGQVAGYDRLCRVNNIPTGDWGCSIRLRKTGQIALANFMSRQELDVELQYFLNALTAYRRYVLKEF